MEGYPLLDDSRDLIGGLSAKSPPEIVDLLAAHGCQNLTSSIDLGACSEHPFAGGGFCDVYPGSTNDGTKVAIKSLRLYERPGRNKDKEEILKQVATELFYWSRLKHRNLVPSLGLAVFRGHVSMVSAWMENRDLISYISSNPSVDRMDLCIDICAGILYIHENNLVHGDLKAASVLVSRDGSAMISDFGNSQLRNLTLKFTNATSTRFSVRWAAPENFQEGGTFVSKKLDVYAYGMTVLEALTGKPPFDGLHEHQVLIMVTLARQTPARPINRMSDEIWEILQDCWRWEHSERPDIAAVGNRLLDLLARFVASAGSFDDIDADLQKLDHRGASTSPLDNDFRTSQVERLGEPAPEQKMYRARDRLAHIELLHKKLLSARKRLLAHDHPDVLKSVEILEKLSSYRDKLAEIELLKTGPQADRRPSLTPTFSRVPKLAGHRRRGSWPLCGTNDRADWVGSDSPTAQAAPILQPIPRHVTQTRIDPEYHARETAGSSRSLQATPLAPEGYVASESTPENLAPGLLEESGRIHSPQGPPESSVAFQVITGRIPAPAETRRGASSQIGRIGTGTTLIPILPLYRSMSRPVAPLGHRDDDNTAGGQVNKAEAHRSPTLGPFASVRPTEVMHGGFKP